MSFSCVRTLGLAALALFSSVGLRAESFTGPTFIDFVARGYSNYDVEVYAEVVVGGYPVYSSSSASFCGIYQSSWSFYGESGVSLRFSNIHKVGTQWIADSVGVWYFTNTYGSWESFDLYNVTVASSSMAYGSSEVGGYTMPVSGQIFGSGTPSNAAPAPAINGVTYAANTSIPVGFALTFQFSATDSDGNLNGIRYNAWNSATGFLDNNSNNFIAQSGGSGLVTKTFTLSTPGDWYFWTDARDVPGLTASTPTNFGGFKITAFTSPTLYCTPAFEPVYWNDNGTIQHGNNCYNYSNNHRTDTYAQPGRGAGAEYTNLDDDMNMIDAAVADGLEWTSGGSASPDGKTLIALVVAPGYDYHWYRQDYDGTWSHKVGGAPARNTDESGQIITNPQTCNRGAYTHWVGYFFTPSDCTQGQGHAPIF